MGKGSRKDPAFWHKVYEEGGYALVRARDAKTGRFVPLSYAQSNPDTTVVHTFVVRKRPKAGADPKGREVS